MDCLKGYIGLSAQVATAESNLYVVTLPGISLHNMEKIADKTEQATNSYTSAQIVFDECEQRAIQTFVSAFTAAFNECYKLSDIDIVKCIICENKQKIAVALWYYIGHEIMVERTSTDRLNRFTTIDLKKAKELRDLLIDRAEYELSAAVKGIDPYAGECLDAPLECNEMIRTVSPII
jgi:hypothetical protein